TAGALDLVLRELPVVVDEVGDRLVLALLALRQLRVEAELLAVAPTGVVRDLRRVEGLLQRLLRQPRSLEEVLAELLVDQRLGLRDRPALVVDLRLALVVDDRAVLSDLVLRGPLSDLDRAQALLLEHDVADRRADLRREVRPGVRGPVELPHDF